MNQMQVEQQTQQMEQERQAVQAAAFPHRVVSRHVRRAGPRRRSAPVAPDDTVQRVGARHPGRADGRCADLVAAGELQVQDITGEIKQDANFAITHGGKVIKDGFATQAAARLYIQRCLIAPAQLMLEHEAIGDQFAIHTGAGPKSWSVH